MPSQRTYARRRGFAFLALAGALVVLVLLVRLIAGDRSGPARAAEARQHARPDATAAKGTAAKAKPLAQLPGGGRRILPDRRVVAFYGNPAAHALGALGIGSPDAAADRLARVARSYAKKTRPALGALELLADVAANAPGPDGKYRTRTSDAVILRYLRAARRHHDILILDIQPGRADFPTEVAHLEKWLKLPDVSLALDPEWRMHGSEVPGQVIGHVDAAEINACSQALAQIVRERRLPQKLFIVHQFVDDEIRPISQLATRPGLATVVNVDGFGTPSAKISKYKELVGRLPRGVRIGFKLFFEEDTDRLSPSATLALHPRPEVVVYE